VRVEERRHERGRGRDQKRPALLRRVGAKRLCRVHERPRVRERQRERRCQTTDRREVEARERRHLSRRAPHLRAHLVVPKARLHQHLRPEGAVTARVGCGVGPRKVQRRLEARGRQHRAEKHPSDDRDHANAGAQVGALQQVAANERHRPVALAQLTHSDPVPLPPRPLGRWWWWRRRRWIATLYHRVTRGLDMMRARHVHQAR
jgi:hypothetical protein